MKNITSFFSATLIAILLVVPDTGSSQEVSLDDNLHSMVPANLSETANSLEKMIVFPRKVRDEDVLLRCEAEITSRGEFESPYCYTGDKVNRPYSRTIIHASVTALAKPAVINGEAVRVWMPFSVLFRVSDNIQKVYVFPNHLLQYESYGTQYSAPQRVNIREGARESRIYHCSQPQRSAVRVLQAISADGNAEEVKLIKTNSLIRCEKALNKLFTSYKYIPAQTRNQFIEGLIDEYFFSFDSIN